MTENEIEKLFLAIEIKLQELKTKCIDVCGELTLPEIQECLWEISEAIEVLDDNIDIMGL